VANARRNGSIAFSNGALHYLVHLYRVDAGARGLKSYVQRVVGTIKCAMMENQRSRVTVEEGYVRQIIEGSLNELRRRLLYLVTRAF
jgi:ATP-dependent Lon protease